MADKRETSTNIIAEMRTFKCRNLATGQLEECSAVAHYFADRLEAALKREAPGNSAKLREVVERVAHMNDDGYWNSSAQICNLVALARAALAAPSRNCDVGTPEEQAERYMEFCHNYPKCVGCPCVGRMLYHQCEFAWVQLPYKEEGAK